MRVASFVLFVFSSAVFAAPLKTECVNLTQPLPWSYCKTTTPGSHNRDLLYHFHGRGGSAKTWTDKDYYTELVRQEWTRRGFEPPTVVTVSFGPVWLLVEKNQSPASGLFEIFNKVVMPTVEKTLPRFSGRRLLVGESMGGFNATQIALKSGDLFAKVAILCPAIIEFSPFSSKEVIDKFITSHKAKPDLIEQLVQVARYFMPEEADWLKTSPLGLAQTNLGWRSPKLYLSCGFYDEYGFYRGTEKFASIAEAKGARVQWRPLYGGHCATDAVSVATFLK